MKKYHRELMRVCAEAGLHPRKIVHRKKHLCIICDEGPLFCSSTPSDWRTIRNMKSQARRLLF